MAGILFLAGMAQGVPFFEVVGGSGETQDFAGTPIIPNGAMGFENSTDAISIFLRDTTAADGTQLTIRFDYVGSDGDFSNEFQNALVVPGGTTQWCNKASAGDCDTGYTPLGTGNLDWFGSFAATATMTVQVGQLIPFAFIADAKSNNGGPLAVINGQDAPGSDPNNEDAALAHMAVFNITGGAFNFVSAEPNGSVFALGLTDGNFDPSEMDDDHQDFMVRISVPEPNVLALAALVFGWLAVARLSRGIRA
jgi:hypothetical protein